MPIKLNEGTHKVTFSLPSGETHDFEVKIVAGKTTGLNKNFESKPKKKKESSKDGLNPYTSSDQKTSISKPKYKKKSGKK